MEKLCAIQGCNKPVFCRVWCGMHYMRWLRHGDPQIKLNRYGEQPICAIEGCDKPADQQRYCGMHYRRLRKKGKIGPQKKCAAKGCNNIAMTAEYCEKHYMRFRKYGDPSGHADPKETRKKQRIAKLRNPTRYWLGKKRSLKTVEALRKANWRGGKSFEPYTPEFNKKLKLQIRLRDDFICQECGVSENNLSEKLSVHHIDYDKKNNSPENLISLCKHCHLKTNFSRHDWAEHYKCKNSKVSVKSRAVEAS